MARGQIERTLDAMGVKHVSAVNGRAAWDELQTHRRLCRERRQAVKDFVQLMLTDVEMPEMDGYHPDQDHQGGSALFTAYRCIMHSSLSSMSNQQLGRSVGVDEYVPKFEPQRLAETLGRLLLGQDRRRRSLLEREMSIAMSSA